jgi:hypothetical protein
VRLEVRDAPDRWVPPVGVWGKKVGPTCRLVGLAVCWAISAAWVGPAVDSLFLINSFLLLFLYLIRYLGH